MGRYQKRNWGVDLGVKKAISIIVPVYNAGVTIEQTLDSLREQTFEDFEVLLIDDGSTDDSKHICDYYAKLDDRFLVFHRENRGAAQSRNFGLDKATGKYVVFLDADDYFYPHMLESGYKEAEKYKAECIVWGAEWLICNGDTFEQFYVRKPTHNVFMDGIHTEEELFQYDVVPWNKLIRRDFLMEENIRFQDIPFNNDMYFSLATALLAKRIVFCEEVLVKYYFGRDKSLTSKRQKKILVPLVFEEFYSMYGDYIVQTNRENMVANFALRNIGDIFQNPQIAESGKIDGMELLQNCVNLKKYFACAYEKDMLIPYCRVVWETIKDKRNLSQLEEYEFYLPVLKELLRKNRNKKVAIWGCGRFGSELLYGMEKEGLKFEFLIDGDTNKQGSILCGMRIENYSNVKEMVDVIVATATRFSEEIRRLAEGKEVIDLVQIVTGRR